jgi:hypothetical protein
MDILITRNRGSAETIQKCMHWTATLTQHSRTQALAAAGARRAVISNGSNPVTGIDRDGGAEYRGNPRQHPPNSSIVRAIMRSANGGSKPPGASVPMVVMSHQYFSTRKPMPAWCVTVEQKSPPCAMSIFYYLRQDKNGLEPWPPAMWNCKAH